MSNRVINFLILAAIAMSAAFTSCGKDKDDKDDVILVTEIVTDWGNEINSLTFEYDDQHRITKITQQSLYDGKIWGSVSTLQYNAAGDLVRFEEEDGDFRTFARLGNRIAVTSSWWGNESGVQRSHVFDLNAQGLLEKITWKYNNHNNGNWDEEIITFQYLGGNIIKMNYEWEAMWYGESGSESVTANVTYDDKHSPFLNTNTPQWFLAWWFDEAPFGTRNNIKTMAAEDDDGSEYSLNINYSYNSADFPVSRVITGFEEGGWCNNCEEYHEDEEWTYSQTFSYGPSTTKHALSGSNSLQESPREMRRDNPRPFGRNVCGR